MDSITLESIKNPANKEKEIPFDFWEFLKFKTDN